MPLLVRAKAILPKGQLQPGVIATEVRNQVTTEGRRIQRLLEGTVKTWRNKPSFVPVQRVAPTQSRVVSVTVRAGGNAQAVDHFGKVNNGTTYRISVMSPRFRPKTTPGSLRAGPGHPPFDPVGFGLSPGIKARHFTQQIHDLRQPEFSRNVRAAIQRGIRKRGP